MDREKQIELLRGSRNSLLAQQETLKEMLVELSVQSNELNRLIEWLTPSAALTQVVEQINAKQAQKFDNDPGAGVCGMPKAQVPTATSAPTLALAKPARTLRSASPPKKHDVFQWNNEEYTVVNVLAEGSFRAKLTSKIKLPGKPFEFRWEKAGFTVSLESK